MILFLVRLNSYEKKELRTNRFYFDDMNKCQFLNVSMFINDIIR